MRALTGAFENAAAFSTGGRVDGWTGGRVDGWTGGRVDGWTGGRVDGWTGGRVDGWTGGRVDGWTGGRVDGWTGGRVDGWTGGRVDGWTGGRVDGWTGGRVDGWTGGRVDGWTGGRVVGWRRTWLNCSTVNCKGAGFSRTPGRTGGKVVVVGDGKSGGDAGERVVVHHAPREEAVENAAYGRNQRRAAGPQHDVDGGPG